MIPQFPYMQNPAVPKAYGRPTMLGASGSADASILKPLWQAPPPDDTGLHNGAGNGAGAILLHHQQLQQQVAAKQGSRSRASGSRSKKSKSSGPADLDGDEDSDSFDKAPSVNELFLINQVDLPKEMQVGS
jgi:hypothetical protein